MLTFALKHPFITFFMVAITFQAVADIVSALTGRDVSALEKRIEKLEGKK